MFMNRSILPIDNAANDFDVSFSLGFEYKRNKLSLSDIFCAFAGVVENCKKDAIHNE
jgi:hypothetical protein